mmetsp:Transcript_95808/g.247716  ORF Transcript_95808/g.247716 Transcript_95808/m.247716 type:complete len:281 (+) Transcript_95808:489-1331(+)
MVRDHGRECRGCSRKEVAKHVRQKRRRRPAEGDQTQADEATEDRVPFVGERCQDGCPKGRVPSRVHDVRECQHGDKERGLVVQCAKLVEGEDTQQATWRHQAREVPHGPRPPDRHPVQRHEDGRQDDYNGNRCDHVHDRLFVLIPAVGGQPRRIVVGRSTGKAAEAQGGHQEQIHLVILQFLHEARLRQHTRLVAAWRKHDQDCQHEHQDDVYVCERSGDDIPDLFVQVKQGNGPERPLQSLSTALHDRNAPGTHLEATVEVLAEIPHQEEQPRRGQHTT